MALKKRRRRREMRTKSIWGPEQQETQQQKWEKGKEKILNSLSTSRPTNKNLSFFVFLYLSSMKAPVLSSGGITQTKEIRDHL